MSNPRTIPNTTMYSGDGHDYFISLLRSMACSAIWHMERMSDRSYFVLCTQVVSHVSGPTLVVLSNGIS